MFIVFGRHLSLGVRTQELAESRSGAFADFMEEEDVVVVVVVVVEGMAVESQEQSLPIASSCGADVYMRKQCYP